MALIGLDVGTSSLKVVLVGEDGQVLGLASEAYPVLRPHPGWSEQDPTRWWGAAVTAIGRVLREQGVEGRDVRAIGLSGQMHGSVLLDGDVVGSRGVRGEAVRPALLWNDQRTAAWCEEIERVMGGKRALVERVGNAALPGFTLPKLLWVRSEEPANWERVRALLLPKDYIGFRLTGRLATDVGDASGTLLFDVDKRAWSTELIERFGLDGAILPPAFESGVVVGEVSSWAAAQTGLACGTPVVAGSGDNQAGAIGAGVVRAGEVLATLGTSGVIYAHASGPRRDLGVDDARTGRLHTMCAANGSADRPGSWSVTGCMLSAAGALQWARETIAPDVGFEELMREASGVPRGSGGLLFMPHLSGERCPYPDPLARGGWIGLTARHTRAHLIRAVIEGVTFSMGQILDLVREAGVPVERVRLGGGGARSGFWRQMQADVYGAPVATTNTEEGPAYGAALLAGVGVGVWRGVGEAVDATVYERERIEPDERARKEYSPAREAFTGLYAGLKDRFAALAAIDRDADA